MPMVFWCRSYVLVLLQITKTAKLTKKQVDDVLGGEEAWKNVQKTDGGACSSSITVKKHIMNCIILHLTDCSS